MKYDYKKYVKNKLLKIEKLLNSQPKLSLEKYATKEQFSLPEGIDIKEFILNFLTSINKFYSTVIDPNREVDTLPGKYRSFGDIYRICKTYFPDIRLIDVFTILVSIDADPSINFKYYYCPTIKKRCISPEIGDNAIGSYYLKNRNSNEFKLTERALNSLLK